MNKVLNALVVSLSLAACGAGGDESISLESNPELFTGESAILGDWIRETDLPYTNFLRIEGSSGFSCNNDGKSVSGPVELVNGERGVYIRSSPGHGAGDFAYERVELDSKTGLLLLHGEENGTLYTSTYRRGVRPDICQRLQDGKDVSFEELRATWGPTED